MAVLCAVPTTGPSNGPCASGRLNGRTGKVTPHDPPPPRPLLGSCPPSRRSRSRARQYPSTAIVQPIPHARSNAPNDESKSGAMGARQGTAAHRRWRECIFELVCSHGTGKQRGRDGEAVGAHALSEELGPIALRRKAARVLAVGTVHGPSDRTDGAIGGNPNAATEGQAGGDRAVAHGIPRHEASEAIRGRHQRRSPRCTRRSAAHRSIRV